VAYVTRKGIAGIDELTLVLCIYFYAYALYLGCGGKSPRTFNEKNNKSILKPQIYLWNCERRCGNSNSKPMVFNDDKLRKVGLGGHMALSGACRCCNCLETPSLSSPWSKTYSCRLCHLNYNSRPTYFGSVLSYMIVKFRQFKKIHTCLTSYLTTSGAPTGDVYPLHILESHETARNNAEQNFL